MNIQHPARDSADSQLIKMADIERLKELNLKLWSRVQDLELRANQVIQAKKRD